MCLSSRGNPHKTKQNKEVSQSRGHQQHLVERAEALRLHHGGYGGLEWIEARRAGGSRGDRWTIASVDGRRDRGGGDGIAGPRLGKRRHLSTFNASCQTLVSSIVITRLII